MAIARVSLFVLGIAMRIAFALIVATFALVGCQSNQELGSPGSCNQAGSSVSAPVMCPNG